MFSENGFTSKHYIAAMSVKVYEYLCYLPLFYFSKTRSEFTVYICICIYVYIKKFSYKPVNCNRILRRLVLIREAFDCVWLRLLKNSHLCPFMWTYQLVIIILYIYAMILCKFMNSMLHGLICL